MKETTELQPENFVAMTEIKTIVKNGLTKLSDPELVESQLIAIAKTVPDDVEVTIETLKESKFKNAELRDTRYALQNISKANQSSLNDTKKTDKEYYLGLIDIIKPKENLLSEGIKVIEEKKKAEKQEKADEEKNRIEAIRNKISSATNYIAKESTLCKTQNDIAKLQLLIDAIDDKWITDLDEFEYMGHNLKTQANDFLNSAKENVSKSEELEKIKADNLIIERDRLLKEKEAAAQKVKEDEEKAIAAQKENEKRLKEIAIEKQKLKVANDKIKAMEEAKELEIKELKEKEENSRKLMTLNFDVQKIWDKAKKLGLKVSKKPGDYKEYFKALERFQSIKDLLTTHADEQVTIEYKTQLERVKNFSKPYIQTSLESLLELGQNLSDVTNHKDIINASEIKLQAIIDGIEDFKDFLNEKD